MNPPVRPFGASVPKTFRFKLLSITATVLLAVAAVVVSVHSSSSLASRAERTTAKSGENRRAQSELKTSHTAATRSLAPLAPTVTATKTDSLFTDVDGDLQADPGDTLQYTVNIGSIGDDATGLTFTDTVDPNTAFVPGSLTATPVAVDDSYSALGNVRISVPAPGVLGNDFAGVPAGTASAPTTSANGGNVALNADGSFTYNPPAGFEGTDTFSYTLTNGAGSNPATVTITVSGMIWFINNNPGACVSSCDGRLTNPFNTLAAFAAVNNGAGNNPAANDNIFVYESAIDYFGPVALLNGQRFLGQDSTASLSAMTGLTPPTYSDPLPATNSGNAIIVNITSAGNSINVASGNTLRGFTGGNSASDISGSGFGTLTVSDVTLNGTGQALDLTTGTLAANFVSISSTNSATTGISLTSVAGSLSSPSTTITNPVGIGISVGTSTATLDFGNTTSTGSGDTGVSLLTNSGTITFGALDISPNANQRGLLATDNSNTITSTSGAVTTSGAIAVEITRGIGTTPLVMSLTSVSGSGATNGIKLNNTNGSFAVNGTGITAGSGGTIQNISARGAEFINATNVTLKNMNFTNANTADAGGAGVCDDATTTPCNAVIYLSSTTTTTLDRINITGTIAEQGINGNGVNGLTLSNSNIGTAAGRCGDALEEGCMKMRQWSGTSSISNSILSFAAEDVVEILNQSGTLMLNVDSSTFSDTQPNPPGSTGIFARSRGTGSMIINVTNSNFLRLRTSAFNATSQDSANLDVDVSTSTFDSEAGIGIGVVLASDDSSNMLFNIQNNPRIWSRNGIAVSVLGAGTSTFSGRIQNNPSIQVQSGSGTGIGTQVNARATGVVLISGNTVSNVPVDSGITAIALGKTVAGAGGTLDATITNNNVTIGSGATYNIETRAGSGSPGELNQPVCVNVANNVIGDPVPGAPLFGGIFTWRARVANAAPNATLRAQGFVTNIATTWAANGNTPTAGTSQSVVGGGTPISSCTATLPSNPTLNSMQPEDDMAASQGQNEVGADSTGTENNNILRAASDERTGDKSVQKLSQPDLLVMAQAAIERWKEAGISAEDLMRLQAVTFEIADLPDDQLATATSTSIQIDETAAGYGWFLDLTSMDDAEFDVPVPGTELQTTELGLAHGRGMDVLTAVMRQLGTVYLQGKERLPKQLGPLMQNTLSPAVRRLPDAQNIQLSSSKVRASGKNQSGSATSPVAQSRKGSVRRPKTGVSTMPVSARKVAFNPGAKQASDRNSKLMHHAPRNRTRAAMLSSMLADVMLNIGTLPVGESVTITFNVTVDDPFGGALPQVSNQGTVSGSNFADVLTDDPTVGGTADPTITPIDLPQVTVAVSPTSVLEDGATNLVYTFTRNGSTASAMTVNFSVGGTASFTEPDYTQTGAATFTATSGTVVILSGSSTATVTIDPSADTTVEPDQTVDLTVAAGIGYTVGSPSSASGTITNDDTDVSVAVSPASVAEDGATNLVYTFTRVGVTTNSLTVNFSIAVGGNNAVFPVDYSQSGATTFAPPVGTVTFGAGNSTATVTIDPVADLIVEPDETVIFTVTSGADYNVGSPGSATGTITNEDADVSVTVAPGSATEDGATNLVYTFTRTGFTLVPVTVNFSVGGTAVFSEPDYTQTGAATYSDTSGTLVFGVGDSTATVTVDPATDTTVEPDETVILTVTSGTGYNVGSPDSATGAITNDDTDVSVAVSPGSVAEDGATNLVYTFTRNGVTSSALTVNFSVGGSAVFGPSPDDYTQTGATTYATTSGTVTFTAGNSTATVTVNPEADSTVESDETVDLTVTSGAGYNVGLPSAASGPITNDDTDVSIAVSPASVAEDGATNLVYTFTRNGVTSGALTVNFSVGGTAVFGPSPDDYTQTGAATYTTTSGTVTFGAGNSTATVTVNPETDTTIETDETVILTLPSGAGYNVSSPSSATGTITNDDADVSVAVAPASVAEDGATSLVYTFTRTGFTGGALTVNFSVGGTAVFGPSPDDYTQTGATTYTTTSGSVTFAPGSPTATVTVDPETDTTAESDETVVITLTAGASYNVVSPNSATGTILNDDTLVSVVVAPGSTAEGGANMVYTFTRTGPTTSALSVNFSVGGSASFPGDYSQNGATTFTPPTATVTFGVGSSTATVTVTPLTDCMVEGNETVDFTVQPGSGYGVGSPSTATGTITNTPDSAAPTITLIPNVNMTLWPPNHQYESIAVTDFVASASDNCDPSVNVNSVYILKITSDEAENGNGDGNTLNDIVIGATCKTAQLRSERAGNEDGRVYTITFKVKDSAGNFATATTTVTVRKSPNKPAVDSGTAYTVNSVCP